MTRIATHAAAAVVGLLATIAHAQLADYPVAQSSPVPDDLPCAGPEEPPGRPPCAPPLPPWPNSDLRLNSSDGFTGWMYYTVQNFPDSAWIMAAPIVYTLTEQLIHVPLVPPQDIIDMYQSLQPNGSYGRGFSTISTRITPTYDPTGHLPWDPFANYLVPGEPQDGANSGNYIVNLTLPEVRELASTWIADQAIGWPHIYMDRMMLYAAGGAPPGIDDQLWADACVDLIIKTCQKAHAHGTKVLPNVAAIAIGVVESPVFEYVDGVSLEMFMINTWPFNYITPEWVVDELTSYRTILDAGKALILRPFYFNDYPLAAAGVMLIREPGDPVFLSTTFNPNAPQGWGWMYCPEAFGAALGPYQVIGDNVYKREFQNATITVDYYARTYTVTGDVPPG